jgi:hypothetical protein
MLTSKKLFSIGIKNLQITRHFEISRSAKTWNGETYEIIEWSF